MSKQTKEKHRLEKAELVSEIKEFFNLELVGDSSFTLDEISKFFGLSRERVRQIETNALKKLRSPSISKEFREILRNKE